MTGSEDTKGFRSIFVRYDVQKYLGRLTILLNRYPALSVCSGIVVAFYTVPITVYIAFSIIAFLCTFVGFLIILGKV